MIRRSYRLNDVEILYQLNRSVADAINHQIGRGQNREENNSQAKRDKVESLETMSSVTD